MMINVIQNKKGFALVTSLLTMLILLAIAALIYNITTKDTRISTRLAGEQMAFAASEYGLFRLMANFNPGNLSASVANNQTINNGNNKSAYSIDTPASSKYVSSLSIPGFSITSGKSYQFAPFQVRVTGTNNTYGTAIVQKDVGLGYGPVDTSTIY